MKKLIILLILLVGAFTATDAQNKTGRIDTGKSFTDNFRFTNADTIAAGRTSYTIVVEAPQHYPTTQDLEIKLDSIATPGASLQLTGSKFGTTYANIGSPVVWAGTSADTTIVISNATANRYRYYKLTVSRTAGSALITSYKFKLYYE